MDQKIIKNQTKDNEKKEKKAREPRTPVMDEKRMKNEKNLGTKKGSVKKFVSMEKNTSFLVRIKI